MQQIADTYGFTRIKRVAPIAADTHGGRAKCLQRLLRLDLPVPSTVAISFDGVRRIAAGEPIDTSALLRNFGDASLVSVRPSSQDPDWGGPGAILNIGMNAERHNALTKSHGKAVADALYLRFVQSYSVNVERLDPEIFEDLKGDAGEKLQAALDAHEFEMEEAFPQDPAAQLREVLLSMARAWDGTSARLLRQARGAPADAGLGLVVQEMALGLGQGVSGSGLVQLVDSKTGLSKITGRYVPQSQRREAVGLGGPAMFIARDERGPSLEETFPDIYAELMELNDRCRTKLREEMQMEFVLQDGKLHVIDSVRIARSPGAAIRIAVDLARDGVISEDEAVLRVEPRSLSELLHPQIADDEDRPAILAGIPASPGAAAGRIVFSSVAAQASAAKGEPCILVRRETTPEDIRGMHQSVGVLTERGGITSHAAVIARGIGLPCIVGVSDMRVDTKAKRLELPDGRELVEGDLITIDGRAGQAFEGAAKMSASDLDESFQLLLGWADNARDVSIRVNADTIAEAKVARRFMAEGIGLCRTEHMFFEADRLTVMREMIFAESDEDRAAALERLLPMQRDDFVSLFQVMQGQPVCIRLFDPPLHEFLPVGKDGIRQLAGALNLPVSDVATRIADLSEVNPMLGMRGVRLGITVPEIYDMQARAIFEATIAASEKGDPVVPEVMIPLVSARKEVELVRARIEAVAASVQAETGVELTYRLGVMVETPRAALRAHRIGQNVSFLSFGTNDLTQMTYGLSRDDAGRFMNDYVNKGVFREDPFQILDKDGVGELLSLGAERARSANPDLVLSICGEHGGNPESIEFCRDVGFDYVSCSPYRVPVARLAAGHLALKQTVSI